MERLISALQSSDQIIQADAARLLGELKNPQAIEPLVSYVNSSRYYSKMVGFESLTQIGDPRVCNAIRHLVAYPNVADDGQWYANKSVRAAAALTLLHFGDAAGVSFLQSLAENNDITFIGWLSPVITRLPDSPETAPVKKYATIERLLGNRLEKYKLSDPSAMIFTVQAIETIGGEEAIEKLNTIVQYYSRYVRAQAALSLLNITTEKDAVNLIKKMAQEDNTDFARIKASLALGLHGVHDFISTITSGAGKNTDPFLQAIAIEALGMINNKKHVSLVEEQLSNADPYVRLCAIEALERMDASAEAVARLEDDVNKRVQLQAIKYACVRGGNHG